MTKKRSSEIFCDENRKSFWEKVTLEKFFVQCEIFSDGHLCCLPR